MQPCGRTANIYLEYALLRTSICLPWIIRRAALNRSYTWHFSTQGLPACTVASTSRGLLPHIFTFTLFLRTVGSNFLWHCLVLFSKKPAVSRCVALCCPDFPTLKQISIVGAACSAAKIRHCTRVAG